MTQLGLARTRTLIGLAAFAIIAGACTGGSGSSAAASGGASGSYTVGISNPGAVGNGWREAMICSAKAQAVAAGNVKSVTAFCVVHHEYSRPMP